MNARDSMLYTDAFDSAPLFVGSTHIAVENEETSEMAREWTRQQLAEAAARLSPPTCQIVDLPPKLETIPPLTHAPLSA